MKISIRWLAGLFLSVWWLGAPAAAYDAELWTHFTSQNIVTSIAEGEDEIYFGTSGGVRRYHRFRQTWLRPITTADDLPDNFVRQIEFDPDTGDLHIETRTGAARWMSRLDALAPGGFHEFRPVNYVPRIPNVVPPFGYYINGDIVRGPHRNYRILDVHIDSWNVLWLATDGLGIGRADLTFNQLEFFQSGPLAPNVTALALDGASVWVGGTSDFTIPARGISRFDRDRQTWTYYEEAAIARLDDTQINDILADSSDVWFGTDRGVVRYRKSEDAWDTYRFSRAASTRRVRHTNALALGASRLWLGTEEGLAVLDLKADTLRAVAGSQNFRIYDLAAGTNFVWAATNKGLFRCPSGDVTWAPVTGLADARRPVLAVAASGDTTWALASAPPVLLVSTHADSAWTTFRLPEAAGSDRASLSGAGNRVWVGTPSGIVRVSTKSGKSTSINSIDGLLDDRVLIVKLEGQDVWIGTRSGLSRYRWKDDFRGPGD